MATTIAISTAIRDRIKEFGMKGETYDEILERLLTSAEERQLRDILMSTKGCITIDEARARAEKKWQK
ncbi:hypothetical protein JW756_01005 [Candidatus Woesearchaeota archaeon]|nr:hypothetical protein [Candidatus Woesearchaeota archaeon]